MGEINIDKFVRDIMTALESGKACGGLDYDQSNPHSTTSVVVGEIRERMAEIERLRDIIGEALDCLTENEDQDRIALEILSRARQPSVKRKGENDE